MTSQMDAAAWIEEIRKRPRQAITCDRILLPTDGSGQAFQAVREAVRLAAVTQAEITLLMVVDYNQEVAAFEQVSLSGYVPAELKIAAYQFLADLMHAIPSEIHAHTRVEVGSPGEVILQVSEEEESDMIVMGTHGFGTFRSILQGSVSRFVTQHAACPVLLCRGLPAEWELPAGK
ncbi:Nucleotide-binding universal stress protein, UspA family [Selenomonas ruminantium]|uniref:Nucleotide-binding universal stress protein, UspA family n=2 Tax=Selenomonas ruminantium TaxID=971 RepID=A0A1I3GHG0_SELRU|nr:Nucleotide-binding universal stress protein, UspA family [Selenomonas ruminantium]